MLKSIIKNIPFVYKIVVYYRRYRDEIANKIKKKSFDKFGYKVIEDLYRMIFEKKYNISLYYGTLLGIVRDGKLLEWDDDLDFAIFDMNNNFSWSIFENDLLKIGFKKYRIIEMDGKIIAQSYHKNGVLCDFFIKNYGEGNVVSLYGGFQIKGKQYINGKPQFHQYWKVIAPKTNRLIEKKINNFQVLIPENYNSILKSYYGEDWNIPDQNFYPKRSSIEKITTITYL